MSDSFSQAASTLVNVARGLHARGWMLGTSGNISAVVHREPLQLAMTQSGVDKGELTESQILLIDEHARTISSSSKPSDESPLHIRIVKEQGAGAVLHTHSIWNTILSDLNDGVMIEGYEMLKGLSGVHTHEHREWLPTIENSQDMSALAESVSAVLAQHASAHGFLLRRHGLYTWGRDLNEARRHAEILEFLLETLGRTMELRQHRAM